ncbi:MAG: hypothetical protein LBU65_17795 [Planctomycetaceae bacterium]|nr:hypothetical protein [Planctomycetaceae bacterium]
MSDSLFPRNSRCFACGGSNSGEMLVFILDLCYNAFIHFGIAACCQFSNNTSFERIIVLQTPTFDATVLLLPQIIYASPYHSSEAAIAFPREQVA